MKFSYKMLTSDGKATKNIDQAMWLLLGTDLTAEPITIGNRNKSISDVELRAFMDVVVYERYAHELTTPTRHIYAWVDIDDGAENAGAEEVQTKDGFKSYMQISIDAGVKSLSKFDTDPDFKNGPTLRLKKHARIKVLLEDIEAGGFCHKVYIAHKRNYIHEGMFLTQMELVLNGELEEALAIRNRKIQNSAGTRKTAHLIRTTKDDGHDKINKNWAQVQEQLADIEAAKDAEPVLVEGEDDIPNPSNNGDNRELFMRDYHTKQDINMFELEAGSYGARRHNTPGFWDWDPSREQNISDWLIMKNAGYTIDLELTR